MTKTETDLELMIKPCIEQLGYELYDVEFIKESTYALDVSVLKSSSSTTARTFVLQNTAPKTTAHTTTLDVKNFIFLFPSFRTGSPGFCAFANKRNHCLVLGY